MNYKIIEANIKTIKAGDAVMHNGKIMTVGASDIKRDGFMGVTIFGDSYRLGRLPVKKVEIVRAIPVVS